MSSLLELAAEFNGLLNLVDVQTEANEESAEFSDTLLIEMLSELGMELDDKCDNMLAYIKQLTLESKGLSAEAKVLTARAKAKTNRIDSLKKYIVASGVTSYESTAGKIMPSSSDAVIVDDLDAVPTEYTNTKTVTTTSADKNAIKKLLRMGDIEIAGCHLEIRESVLIK